MLKLPEIMLIIVPGMKNGEIKDINVTFPVDYHEQKMAGKNVTFKVTLKGLKEQKLPETLSKRLIDLATKENSEGELLIDEMYNKVMQDPKEAKEVILFLADREAYLKTKMLETKKEVELTTFKKFNLIKDKVKKAPQEEKTETEFTFEIPVI